MRFSTAFCTCAFLFCAFGKFLAQSPLTIPLSAPESSWPAKASVGEKLGRTRALSDVQPGGGVQQIFAEGGKIEKKQYFGYNELVENGTNARTPDPVLQTAQPEAAPQIRPIVNLEGIRNSGSEPPDPTGDVGRDHYIQMVNASSGSRFRILNKQGVTVYNGHSSEIWGQVNTGSIGDPIINYDHSTDRWFMVEMQGGNELLVAVTATPDPLGPWDAYRFQTEGFPDYPKMYIWPDAIFITVNEILDPSGNQAAGYALEKSALVAGASAFKVYRFQFPKYAGITYQPATGADWEAGPPPPPGSPGIVLRMLDNIWTGSGSDQIDIWNVNLNWANVGLSSISGPKVLLPAPFESRICHGWLDCIDQPGTSQRITALDQIIMYRAPYRNFGDYESMVLNHISDITNNDGVGGIAGVRWYELRKYPGQEWAINQQGTFAPSQDSRFMGMISQDGSKNIAMGYSIASSNKFPSIGLTGRNATDPPGSMSAPELDAAPGGSAHQGNRWGDYCNMSVDPVDDRTFWFTAEYQPQDDFWATKIISFQLQKDTFDISPIGQIAPVPSPVLSTAETVSVQINNYGLSEATAVSVECYFEGTLLANELVGQIIQPDGAYVHTFQPKVDMSAVGKFYHFTFVTRMVTDKFALNDTLRTVVRKLTSNDAGLKPAPKFNAEMCSGKVIMPVAIYNASALPLTSAQINWKLNIGAWKSTAWQGNLAPFSVDTAFIELIGVGNGQNLISVATSLPNGLGDEDKANDTISYKFPGFPAAGYHYFEFESHVGQLRWEIRLGNSVIQQGTTADPFIADICLQEGSCYTLRLRPTNNNFWAGKFAMKDGFGKTIYYTEELIGQINHPFCVNSRPSRDIGPWEVKSPIDGNGLSANEQLEVAIRNYGATTAKDITIRAQLNNGNWVTESVPDSLLPGELSTYRFNTAFNLSAVGTYQWQVITEWQNDSIPSNDTLHSVTKHLPTLDAAVTRMETGGFCDQGSGGYFQVEFANLGATSLSRLIYDLTLNGQVHRDTLSLNLSAQKTGSYTLFHPLPAQFGSNLITVNLVAINQSQLDANATNNSLNYNFDISADNGPITIVFDANNYGGASGMSWKLVRDANQTILASGGSYPTWQTTGQESFCMPDTACYTLTMYYPGSTGWPGEFEISGPVEPIFTYTGAAFQDSLVYQFCGLDACAGLQLAFDLTHVSVSGATDGAATLHGLGGNPPYFYSLDGNSFLIDSSFTGLAEGNYIGYVADVDQCIRERPFTISVSVASHEPELQYVQISPNPSSDVVRVTLPSSEQAAILVLRDTRGKIILTDAAAPWSDYQSSIFSVSHLADGMYFLTVYRNAKAQTFKLIKLSKR
jgi:hypothetical protein